MESVPPSGFALLIEKYHPRTGPGCGQRRCQTGRSRADDQHVGVDVRRVVLRGVGDLGEAALARNAACGKAVEELYGGGEQHRLGEGVLDLNQATGVLGPCGGEAARATQLDAGGDLMHPVGQQCRGQRVTRMPGQLLVVEDKGERGPAVDASTLGGAKRCGHGVGLCSSGRYTLWNRYVAVSRTALNHRRQPALWLQRSAKSPLGLLRKKT
jgi:hypothetical protein